MITFTYGLAGVLLALTGWLFHAGVLTAQTQTLALDNYFLRRLGGRELAYLTVSEIFPLESARWQSQSFTRLERWQARVGAPILFRMDHRTGSISALFVGYLVAAVLMIFGAIVEAWIGVPAERRSLEHVAAPLSSKGL